MATDPKKLATLVEAQNANPLDPTGMEEEVDTEDMEEETEERTGEDILEELGEFGTELRDSADIIVPMAEEIGEDLSNEEHEPETEAAVEDAVDRMPDHIYEGMASLVDLPREDLNKIGDVLVAEVDTEMTPAGEFDAQESEMVGGLLELSAKYCAGEMEEEPEEEEPEEMEEAV